MNITNEFDSIRDWADKRGIYKRADQRAQVIKLYEEAGELSKAILDNDIEEVKDAIGDCTVVLVNLAHLSGLKFEDCVNSAYEIIAKRTGKMVDGVFIKDK